MEGSPKPRIYLRGWRESPRTGLGQPKTRLTRAGRALDGDMKARERGGMVRGGPRWGQGRAPWEFSDDKTDVGPLHRGAHYLPLRDNIRTTLEKTMPLKRVFLVLISYLLSFGESIQSW